MNIKFYSLITKANGAVVYAGAMWHPSCFNGACDVFSRHDNAELGFIALSQIYKDGQHAAGSYWMVPAELYPQLKQDALLLQRGEENTAARALLAYMQSDTAEGIIRSYGYTL